MTDRWLLYWNLDKLHSSADPRLEAVTKVIAEATLTGAPDIVALSEVGNCRVLDELALRLGNTHVAYSLYKNAPAKHEKKPPQWLDMGILLRKGAVRFGDVVAHHIGGRPGSTRRCVVARLEFEGVSAPPISLGIGHWWSRGSGDQDALDEKRRIAARWLCDTVASAGLYHTIVVGDFNLDPYDPILCYSSELTTRFAALARSSGRAPVPLYNTAWRFLQDPLDLSGNPLRSGHAGPYALGSYRYEGRWRVFDQLMASGQLLSAGDATRRQRITLVEDSIRYLTHRATTVTEDGQACPSKQLASDHFPILARLVIT